MSYLTIDADRLVRDAVDAFLEGTLRPDPLPDTLYATKNSRYRIVAGMVHEASDTSLMGAELVGWLVVDDGLAQVEPRWSFRARAIFVERTTKEVVVTSRVIAKSAVTEHAPVQAQKGSIPPAPPIPMLKNGPSIAPPALLSLGPEAKGRLRLPSEEEITKVEEFTAIATQDQLHQLREISVAGAPLPIGKHDSERPGKNADSQPPSSRTGPPRASERGNDKPTVRPPPPAVPAEPPTLRDAVKRPPPSRAGGPVLRAPWVAARPSNRGTNGPVPPPPSTARGAPPSNPPSTKPGQPPSAPPSSLSGAAPKVPHPMPTVPNKPLVTRPREALISQPLPSFDDEDEIELSRSDIEVDPPRANLPPINPPPRKI